MTREVKDTKSLFLKYFNLFFIFAGLSVGVYFSLRIFFFFSARYTLYDFIFAAIILVAEAFIILHAVGFLLSMYNLKNIKTSYGFKKIPEGSWPSVAVLLPVRNEPIPILEKTIATLKYLDYENKNIYFIDDSNDVQFVNKNKKLVKQYGINYFRPQNLNTAKAGAINEFLQVMKEDYLAIFDADQNPMPSFLKDTVSIAEYDAKIAFVQTPQLYSNIDTSTIAKGAAMQQSIFFEGICEAKASVGAMFCCGTNVLIRKHALRRVGGFQENSITEDFATSIKLHILGYKSVYYNHVRAFGMAPENLAAYFAQQARWSGGTIRVLMDLTKYIYNDHDKLTFSQWWEYFLSSSYYFVGWAFFMLMICPIFFLLFNMPAYFIQPDIYFAIFIPYYLSTLMIFYGTMTSRNYRFIDVYQGSMLSSLIFPVLMISTIKALFGKRMVFKVTPKGVNQNMPFLSLWPWTLSIALNILAIIIGIFKFKYFPMAISINILWCLYSIFILVHIYYFNIKQETILTINRLLALPWKMLP